MEMGAGEAEPILGHMILAGQMVPSLYPNPGSANLFTSTSRRMRRYPAPPPPGGLSRVRRWTVARDPNGQVDQPSISECPTGTITSCFDHSPHCVLDIETAGPITQAPDTYELLFTGVKFEQHRAIFRSNRSELELLAAFVDGFRGMVVTFNGSRFDLPILGHALQLATGGSLRVSKHYDILSKVEHHAGRRISLDALARENLRIGKSEWDHRRNKEIWQSSPELLIAHNQEDLNLTASLFEIVLQRQPLKVDGKSVLLPLDPFKPLP